MSACGPPHPLQVHRCEEFCTLYRLSGHNFVFCAIPDSLKCLGI